MALLRAAIPWVLLASSGCFTVYDRAVDQSLGYRSPIGIRIDLTRNGTPIPEERFAQLAPGTSDLTHALALLGSPHRLRRTAADETLEYYYVYNRKTRLLFRPLFFIDYGNLASYNYRDGETGPDVVALVFDHGGRLLRKEFRHSAPETSFGATLENVFVP